MEQLFNMSLEAQSWPIVPGFDPVIRCLPRYDHASSLISTFFQEIKRVNLKKTWQMIEIQNKNSPLGKFNNNLERRTD